MPAESDPMAALIDERQIKRVVHFTTNRGVLGVLATGKLLSRARLPEEKYLEHIFTANSDFRKDPAWLDYVNLSIGAINGKFFEYSNRQHVGEDLWWAVLAFDPVILCHSGVYFCTSNNIYSGTLRAQGAEGLAALYDERVHQYLGNWAIRQPTRQSDLPTCPQAEVLYPGEVTTEYLRTLYVSQDAHAEAVAGMMASVGHREVPIEVDPSIFAPTR